MDNEGLASIDAKIILFALLITLLFQHYAFNLFCWNNFDRCIPDCPCITPDYTAPLAACSVWSQEAKNEIAFLKLGFSPAEAPNQSHPLSLVHGFAAANVAIDLGAVSPNLITTFLCNAVSRIENSEVTCGEFPNTDQTVPGQLKNKSCQTANSSERD